MVRLMSDGTYNSESKQKNDWMKCNSVDYNILS